MSISPLPYYDICDILVDMSKRKSDNWMLAELLAAFNESGLKRYAWAKAADVDYCIVHGLVAGTRDVTLGTASRLASVLGLEWRRKRKKRRP